MPMKFSARIHKGKYQFLHTVIVESSSCTHVHKAEEVLRTHLIDLVGKPRIRLFPVL